MTEVPLRVRADDPQYQRQLAGEAAFWERPQLFSIEMVESVGDGPFDRYGNRRFTGDERTPWYDTVSRHGPFRRGLLLGVSGLRQEARILETNPELHLTMMDASPGSLQRRHEALGPRFGTRMSLREQDLNFVQIEPGAYDVIISSGALHHIINIEHVAAQIAAGLAPGGWFFLQDYVAEERFDFSPEKRAFFEAFVARSIETGAIPTASRVRWPSADPWPHSPFEAIRSTDTLAVLRQHLDEVSCATTGAVIGLLMFLDLPARPNRWRKLPLVGGHRHLIKDMSPRFVREVEMLDEVMCDSGVLLPLQAFAAFRRRP